MFDKSPAFTATVHAYGIIRFLLHASSLIRQQLNGSHERSTQAVRTPRFLSVRSLGPDH